MHLKWNRGSIWLIFFEWHTEKISPSEFEKHAGLKALSNWKTHVWVFVNGDKVPLRKTKLLKYYKGSASDPSEGVRPRRSRTVHRDELIRCVACGKDRRFLRRNKAECMIYHQATKASETWTCSNYPHEMYVSLYHVQKCFISNIFTLTTL